MRYGKPLLSASSWKIRKIRKNIDVLILAKELDAAVIASDYGIEKWAEQLGVRFVPANTFPMMMKEYLKHLPEIENEPEPGSRDKSKKRSSEELEFI